MSVAALAIEGLHQAYGKKAVLRGLELELAAGELLVVLGATGAGKTTLLRTIAGLEPQQHGTIRIAGEDVSAAAPAERDVALVFQNFSLYPDRSVRQNLEFPLRAPGRRASAAVIAERVAWAAALLRIEHLLERPANRLSGGEMQRVAIGRAIVRRPRLFLFDEPLSNLDAKLRESLRVELATMQRELGTAMLYVTHDQAEALSMADRIAVLQEGAIQQCGPPEEVYARPRTTAVARALGSPPINLLEVVGREGAWRLPGGRALLAEAGAAGRATLGLRPEHLALRPGLAGRVLVVEDMGPSKTCWIEWEGVRLHAQVQSTAAVRAGQHVELDFREEHCLLWPGPPAGA